jgi:exonuclease III
VRELVRREKIELLALQETKLGSIDHALCCRLWGGDNVAWRSNPALGRSGGLLLLWDKDKGKLLDSFQGQGFLGILLEWGPQKKKCVIINVYAPCNLVAKRQLWVELVVARNTFVAEVWCFLGDFNSVRCMEERKGVGGRGNREISKVMREDQRLFNLLIDNLELEDLVLLGRKFTWVQPNGECFSRLDRVLVSNNWREVWGDVSLWALPRDVSDHCPILLRYALADWGPKPFRFNNYWLKNKEFKKVVARSWIEISNNGWMARVFREKLKAVREALKKWNVETYGVTEAKIPSLVASIHDFEVLGEVRDLTEAERVEWKKNCDHLWALLKSKDRLEFQRSKSKWLKEGDVNSSYFHACVKGRKCTNNIVALKKGEGWLENPSCIKEEICNYFVKHFSEERWNRPTMDGIVFPNILEEEATFLERPFEEGEVKDIIEGSQNNKSPGPDGFNFEFFKGCWEVIKGDLMKVFHEFFANSTMPRGMLSYFITLIPKVPNPHSISEFRPISLLGSLYKIVAKVLATRLGSVMEKIISKNQSAFIKGRLLVDGVLTINEVVDLAKRSKGECMIFKVDFEKAYDSVNWKFLEYMLGRFGFSERWIGWIKACVCAGNLSVLVNGSPTREVNIARGLKQGDPLAPFLFLLVAEGIGLLMSRAVSIGFFKPFVFRNSDVVVSHLQYADDTLFIGDACVENLWCIKAILRWFELMSGLKVNFGKSRIFGVGLEESFMLVASKFLNCKRGKIPFIYLGLPVGANHRKEVTWEPVIEVLKRRLHTWKNRFVSLGGRVILINSVLAAIPLFYLSFMKIPIKVWKKIVSIQRNFLWGGV